MLKIGSQSDPVRSCVEQELYGGPKVTKTELPINVNPRPQVTKVPSNERAESQKSPRNQFVSDFKASNSKKKFEP